MDVILPWKPRLLCPQPLCSLLSPSAGLSETDIHELPTTCRTNTYPFRLEARMMASLA